MTSTDPKRLEGLPLPDGPSKPAMLGAVHELLDFIDGKPLDEQLEIQLNQRYGAHTEGYRRLLTLLRQGIDEGWACYSEIDGPDYLRGRIAEASAATHGFTVESGKLKNVRGNYHRHPKGEINMIGPVDATGQFCGSGAGWRVFAPDTMHYPTVTGGLVTLLFFLPEGQIEYRVPNDR